MTRMCPSGTSSNTPFSGAVLHACSTCSISFRFIPHFTPVTTLECISSRSHCVAILANRISPEKHQIMQRHAMVQVVDDVQTEAWKKGFRRWEGSR